MQRINRHISEFYGFLLHPGLKRDSCQWSTKTRKFFVLMIFDILIALILLGILLVLNYLKLVDTNNSRIPIGPGANVLSRWMLIIIYVLLVPLIEEAIFRLHLLPGKPVLRIYFVTVVFVGVSFLLWKTRSTFYDLLVAVGGILLITGYFMKQVKINRTISRLWIRRFPVVFYLTAILFGFYHLQNYRLSPSILLFSPLIVAPQLLLGLIAGFMRIRLGFWWGYLSHVIHNTFFFMIPFLLFLSFSTLTVPKQEGTAVNFPPAVIAPEKYDLKIEEAENIKWHSSKINPREIETGRTTIKRIFAFLTLSDTANIKFENNELARKKITIFFRDKSLKQNEKTSYIRYFVLQKLLDKYNLKAEIKLIPAESWVLTIRDQAKLRKQKAVITKEQDTLSYKIISGTLQGLSKEIESIYYINVNCIVNDSTEYTFSIPENDLKKLHESLNVYGLDMEQRKIKQFYIHSK